jgi:copper chaperone CopZ
MHIVTGMLLAALFGRKQKPSLLPMLRTGPVQTVHAIPGRVRFRVPSLVGDLSVAGNLRERLSSVEGVREVDVNPATGSVLIQYRGGIVRPELLFAATVRLAGLDKELEQTPRPLVTRKLRAVLDSLNRVVYDRTSGVLDFTSALLILLAAVGARKMLQQGAAALPAGFTLIWWGVHQLLGRGEE